MCVYLQKSIVTPEGTIQHTRKKKNKPCHLLSKNSHLQSAKTQPRLVKPNLPRISPDSL